MGTFFLLVALGSTIIGIWCLVALVFGRRKKRSAIILGSSLIAILVSAGLYAPYAPREGQPQAAISADASGSSEAAQRPSSDILKTNPVGARPMPAQPAPAQDPLAPASSQAYPDPILSADAVGPIICDTEDQLDAYTAKSYSASSSSPVDVGGCGHMSGRYVVKVIRHERNTVEIRIPDSPRGDKPAFVTYSALSSPDAEQAKTLKYEVADSTVACRRTTDFKEALEAAKELDVQWFRSSSSCQLVHKGDSLFVYKLDAPYYKVCVGPENACFLGWIPFTSVREVKHPLTVIARGRFRICWPPDITTGERPSDLSIPKGVMFLDDGDQDHEQEIDKGLNATIVTTKQVLLRQKDSCAVTTADLIDTHESTWDRPTVKSATVAAKRYYVPSAILTFDNDIGQKPLPDSFSTMPWGYVEHDFVKAQPCIGKNGCP